jgi:hypothetical protein
MILDEIHRLTPVLVLQLEGVVTTIKLPRASYKFDSGLPLGPRGGFGQVFAGESLGGEALAVKKLDILPEEGGHRELAIAGELAGRAFEHLIPFFD